MVLYNRSILDLEYEHLGPFHLLYSDETDGFDSSTNEESAHFDESKEQGEDEEAGQLHPPSYLMTAILAGLYELPPPHILKYQTGWGRRIRYKVAHRTQPNFSPLDGSNMMTTLKLEKMTLTRYYSFEQLGVAQQAFDFDIYRAKINDCRSLNASLAPLALGEEEGKNGLDVSNAGGAFHGQPHFLAGQEPCLQELYKHIREVIRVVENIDGCPERLSLRVDQIECWANISHDGSWNRLHTHEKSAWSGVYYVQCPQDTGYGGKLVLKPTAHPVEDTYKLTTWESERLKNHRACDEHVSVKEVTYIDITPVPGEMVIFPSWLHHCVLPSSMRDEKSPRISVAFNVNWTNRQEK